MSTLSVIFVMLLAVAAAGAAPSEPVANPGWRVAEVFILTMALIGLTHAASRRLCSCLKRCPQRATTWGKWHRRVQHGHLCLWTFATVVILAQCQWAQLVQSNWRLHKAPLMDEFVVLSTLLLPLVACWPAFYLFEHTVDVLIAEREGRPRPAWDLSTHLRHEVKQTFGVVLAPLLLVMLIQDILRLTVAADIAEHYGWLFHVAMLVMLLLLLPLWLGQLWQARPLPAGRLRSRLQDAAARVNLRLRDFLVWPTNHQLANAMVAGFAGPTRYVYFTDRLLDLLTEAELEAVLLHEAAHIRRRHLWLRMLLLLLPVAAWAAATTWSPALPPALQSAVAAAGIGQRMQTTVLLPLLACAYAGVVLGATSRWLEFDADLFALQGQPHEPDQAPPLVAALYKLAAITPDADRPSWMHPSLHRRIEFLQHAVCFPESALRFQRTIRWGAWTLTGCATVILALIVAS